MSEIKNIFINNKGLNFNGHGKLATIEDLNEELCANGQTIEGILQLQDGVYKWISEEVQEQILRLDNETTEEDLDDITGQYIKFSNDKPTLYLEFQKDLDESLEEIISCNFDDKDKMLIGITKMYNSNWFYIYNYWKNNEGKIETSYTMIKDFMVKNIA